MKKQIRTVSDLYPSPWLYPEDLAGKRITLTITAVTVEDVHNPRTHQDEPRIIADFGRSKRLICNKTQAFAIAEVAGTETLADWPGTAITLAPGRAPNGKATIDVHRPAQVEGPEPTPPAETEEETSAVPDTLTDPDDDSPRYADGTPVPVAVHRSFLAYIEHHGNVPSPTEFWPWLHSAAGQKAINGDDGDNGAQPAWTGPDDDVDTSPPDPDDIDAINADLFGK